MRQRCYQIEIVARRIFNSPMVFRRLRFGTTKLQY
ncbi:uncharacterized protein G2W53_029220 [Senna tora]|uniref:Uncharacterized protein n=1 Tax=Senna tora TaxID=362788 RepID=A0A834T6T2_9FABA|nr:uncharacterized protein G2W53_029220 [Senna tora]